MTAENPETDQINGIPSPSTTIEAIPDVQSAPSEAKKTKIFHPSSDSESSPIHPNGSSGSSTSSDPSANGSKESNGPATKEEDEVEVEMAMAMEGEGNDVEAVPLAETVEVEEHFWDLKMTWSGKVYELRVGGNDMVYDFRNQIHELTKVPPERQKLVGLHKGKLSSEYDAVRFGTLGVKNPCKFTMIGTPEAESFKDPETLPANPTDNFDVTYPSRPLAGATGPPVVAPADDPRNIRLLQNAIKEFPITVMNEPREGKGLLVLDLDYTLVDSKPLLAGSLPAEECARPGMHQFLESVYPHYDIVIWSQTHWRWLESKLVELGVLGGTRGYKVCFVADRLPMFPVFTQRNGRILKHEVKPLAYFWARFPQWSAKNTVHIDDLSRNFAMNPGEGIKIRAYNTAGTYEGLEDKELPRLSVYLTKLAQRVDDFQTVDHSKWKRAFPEPPTAPAAVMAPSADPTNPSTDPPAPPQ